MSHTEKRVNLILTQIVPDYQYECLLRFDKYTVIAGHDIHIIIPSWWKKFRLLIIFTKLMDALFNSYAIPGTKIPKNDATITRKKDEATYEVK